MFEEPGIRADRLPMARTYVQACFGGPVGAQQELGRAAWTEPPTDATAEPLVGSGSPTSPASVVWAAGGRNPPRKAGGPHPPPMGAT